MLARSKFLTSTSQIPSTSYSAYELPVECKAKKAPSGVARRNEWGEILTSREKQETNKPKLDERTRADGPRPSQHSADLHRRRARVQIIVRPTCQLTSENIQVALMADPGRRARMLQARRANSAWLVRVNPRVLSQAISSEASARCTHPSPSWASRARAAVIIRAAPRANSSRDPVV